MTDLGTTERLSSMLPAGRLLVTESGIRSRADVERLKAVGAGVFLIGESLVREDNIGAKLQELVC